MQRLVLKYSLECEKQILRKLGFEACGIRPLFDTLPKEVAFHGGEIYASIPL